MINRVLMLIGALGGCVSAPLAATLADPAAPIPAARAAVGVSYNLTGYTIGNIDATIIAQQPKLYPHMAEMRQRIAVALGVNAKKIGVKATTNEQMGFIGREEGIAAMAVASVDLPE